MIRPTSLPGCAPPEKAVRPDTKTLSLELFQAGKTIDEIARSAA